MSNHEDSDLLLGLSSRERRVLGTLYDQHAGRVYGYALLLTRHRRDAARTLQQVFLEAARSPQRMGVAPDLGRAFAVLTREVALEIRGRKRRKRGLTAPSAAFTTPLPDTAGLWVRELEILALKEVEGWQVKEIADLLCIMPHEAADLAGSTALPSKTRWIAPPAGLRRRVVAIARDGLQPWRPIARLLGWWVLAASCVGFAVWMSHSRPRVPGGASSLSEKSIRLTRSNIERQRMEWRTHNALYDLLPELEGQ